MVGEPESVDSGWAAAALPPALVASPAGVVPLVAPSVGDGAVVLPSAVVDGAAPGLVTDEPAAELVPATDVDPAEVLELGGRAGVVPTGLGVGLGAGGRLDEDDGLGVGVGAGAEAPGGGLLGAPPEPKANPMTLPGAGL